MAARLYIVLMKVKIEFRILLSGTVFQNNIEEYFNTLSLARPRFINEVMTALVQKQKGKYGTGLVSIKKHWLGVFLLKKWGKSLSLVACLIEWMASLH